MSGNKDGYVAGLHRGRIPAVELFQVSDEWATQQGDAHQGTVTSQWRIRVHAGGITEPAAEEVARRIAYAGLIIARSQDYLRVGGETIGSWSESPFGYALEIEFSVTHSTTRETYSTNPATPGGTVPDGGAVGGITRTIDWNETSPISILALPAGQAVSNVAVSVETAFNGASPTVTVGVDGDQPRYLGTSDSDLTEDDSVWEADADDTGALTVKVWLTPGVGASAGQIKVQVMTTAA
jgi:hypothetical protein